MNEMDDNQNESETRNSTLSNESADEFKLKLEMEIETKILEENSQLEKQHNENNGNNNSLSSSSSSIVSTSSRSNSKSPDIHENNQEDKSLIKIFNNQSLNDEHELVVGKQTQSYRRSNIKNIIISLYNLNNELESSSTACKSDDLDLSTLIEGYLDMLPNGKSQKSSILLTWKKRYFKLHLGAIYIYEDKLLCSNNKMPLNVYNLMGGKIEYEDNRVICIDDSRGNCLVVRCFDDLQYTKWKNAFELQIIDKSHSLWIKPKYSNKSENSVNQTVFNEKKVLIIDLGTCSIRAGIYSKDTNVPTLFFPNVCSKDLSTSKYKVGFDAFTSLSSNDSPRKSEQLIFPLKSKNVIDKLGIDMECVDAIINYIINSLNITSNEYNVLVVTPQKFGDKVNIQFINMLLEKYNFNSVTLINQALLVLYAYTSNTGIVCDLGEKIDILPICNGITFQSGVTNLSYGASSISEYLNSFISRAHYNYVNDAEQYVVRYVKEKSCYVALNYNNELNKSRESIKYSVDLKDFDPNFKNVEVDMARFQATEGLFNPEIWGLDGLGIHKLILKAIQSCSMDLRREMAKNIYLAGGMSRIPGLVERLEKELKLLLPQSIVVKVNCSPYSYHCSYLGASKFIEQPEYEKLIITKQEWSTETVACLRKWRML